MNTMLNDLNDLISQKIRDQIIRGKDISVMEQLVFMVARYREILPRISVFFARKSLSHFEHREKEGECPVMKLIADLRSGLRTLTSPDPEIIRYGKTLRSHADIYRDQIAEFHEIAYTMYDRLRMMNHQKSLLLAMMSERDRSIAQQVRKSEELFISRISKGIITGTLYVLVIILLVSVMSFFLSRSVTRSVRRVIKGLRKASEGMIMASRLVSVSCSQLSEGTAEQASALEQTSASLEQIDIGVRQNAYHADKSEEIVLYVMENFGKAGEFMKQLLRSMDEISEMSRKAEKLIKTISVISLQTNLLALNAAIESARNHASGTGFSVVVEEVRTLASQTSEASKNTADIIKTTVVRVQEGFQLASEISKIFSDVEMNADKVAKMATKVAMDSSEQAAGVTQINKAVAELDIIVQNHAASGQELAGMAEELNSYGGNIDAFVWELAKLVGERKNSAIYSRSKMLPLD